MAKQQVHIQITEVTVLKGTTKGFVLDVEGKKITIPVDEAIFANYMDQFYRVNPTSLQRNKFATLLSHMRAAYRRDVSDGKRSVT